MKLMARPRSVEAAVVVKGAVEGVGAEEEAVERDEELLDQEEGVEAGGVMDGWRRVGREEGGASLGLMGEE